MPQFFPEVGTDLLVQARDWFEQRGHTVQVFFGGGAEKPDPRVQKSEIVQAQPDDWRAYMREYLSRVEAFKPDLAYAISGRNENGSFPLPSPPPGASFILPRTAPPISTCPTF